MPRPKHRKRVKKKRQLREPEYKPWRAARAARRRELDLWCPDPDADDHRRRAPWPVVNWWRDL